MIITRPIITAVLILGIIGLVFFAVWPNYQELRSLAKDLGLKKQELSQLEEYFEDLERTKEELKQYEESLAHIDAALPDRLSVPEFFIYLQQLSLKNGVALGGLKNPTIKSSGLRPELKEAVFNLSFSGQYSALKNILSDFWRNAKLVEVDAVSFSAPTLLEGEEGEEAPAIFNFNITLRTHSY